MPGEHKSAIYAGLFVLATGVVMVGAIAVLAQRSKLFEERVYLEAKFQNVQGLREDAPVRIGGVVVGAVSTIDLAPPAAPRSVVVTLAVQQTCMPKVRADSVASIRTLGALGDKYVELSIGSQDAAPPTRYLRSSEPIDIYEAAAEGRNAVRRLSSIAASVEEILAEFRKTNALKNLDTATQSLVSIINSIV